MAADPGAYHSTINGRTQKRRSLSGDTTDAGGSRSKADGVDGVTHNKENSDANKSYKL